MEENQPTPISKSWYEKVRAYYFSHKEHCSGITAFFVAFILAFSLSIWASAPKGFPLGDVVTIHSGDSLQQISTELKNENIIRSVFVFRTAVIIFGGERKIIAGDYLLDKKESSLALAYRLIRGSFHLEAVKITIPEGWCVSEITDYLGNKLVKFDKPAFLALAEKDEGYLFPDTYFISPVAKPQDIVDMMQNNFLAKIFGVQDKISASGHSQEDIIKMASILEGEAMPADRPVVAGILWKRLGLGMPLQVDSTFKYINGKNSYDLTAADLKIDSPYNTYSHKGFPPTPINNPGMDSILAALNPVDTNYMYFLTEKDGTIHYAMTFAQHVANKAKYLK